MRTRICDCLAKQRPKRRRIEFNAGKAVVASYVRTAKRDAEIEQKRSAAKANLESNKPSSSDALQGVNQGVDAQPVASRQVQGTPDQPNGHDVSIQCSMGNESLKKLEERQKKEWFAKRRRRAMNGHACYLDSLPNLPTHKEQQLCVCFFGRPT